MSALVAVPTVGALALLESLDLCGKARLLEAQSLCVGVVATGLHPEHFPEIQFNGSVVRARVFRQKGGVRRRRHASLPVASRYGGPRTTNSGADRIFLVRRAGSVPAPSPSTGEHERQHP